MIRETAFISVAVLGCWQSAWGAESSPASVDQLFATEWAERNIEPVAAASDAAFLRRAWLDLAGETAPVERVRAFVADRSPNKRAELVDSLLASDAFADHWSRVIATWLLGRRPLYNERYDGRVLQRWLRQELADGRPYDATTRALITGDGAKDRSGPANFLLRYEARPTELTAAVGRELLGVSWQCAQCHDHPHARWTQADFWGIAACFGRLHVLNGDANGQPLTAVYETRRGELEKPDDAAAIGDDGQRPTKRVSPRMLDGSAPPSALRRQALAEWITNDDNPYFARQTANRVWRQLFGQPLVRSLDDAQSPGSLDYRQRALDQLAAGFRDSKHDLKKLIRAVVLTRPYQLSAGAHAPRTSDVAALRAARQSRLEHFAQFPIRPVEVDVLYRSIARITGHIGHDEPSDSDDADRDHPVDESSSQVAAESSLPLVSDVVDNIGVEPAGTRPEKPARSKAVANAKMKSPSMPNDRPSGIGGADATGRDNAVVPPGRNRDLSQSKFEIQDDDDDALPLEATDWPAEFLGERGMTVQRSLALLHSDYLRDAVRSGIRLAQSINPDRSSDGQIDWLFLATLGRLPTADERAAMQSLRKGRGQAGLEDVLWSLFNSAEFATNH